METKDLALLQLDVVRLPGETGRDCVDRLLQEWQHRIDEAKAGHFTGSLRLSQVSLTIDGQAHLPPALIQEMSMQPCSLPGPRRYVWNISRLIAQPAFMQVFLKAERKNCFLRFLHDAIPFCSLEGLMCSIVGVSVGAGDMIVEEQISGEFLRCFELRDYASEQAIIDGLRSGRKHD